MRIATSLLLVTSLLFLTACETPPPCAWSSRIEFSEQTKDWLAGLEWPDSAYVDFDKIGDHNDLYGRYCPGGN